MEYLDRESEMALLRNHLKRPGASLFVLYGRRRIGKTALLEGVLKYRPRAAYHVGSRSTLTEELSRLSATLAEAWEAPLLRAQPLSSSEALLAFLEGMQGPGVLILDEFPFLVESDPSLPGLIQASWDRKLSRGELKLVFCGSSVGIMQDAFFSSRAPLFGRRTGQLRLGPLPIASLAAVSRKPQEVVELAALFGAIPGYLQRIEPGRGPLSNLRRQVLRRGEPLYEEVPFLLREELREPRVYHAILAAVASGARKFGEISSKVGLDRANISRYLAVLVDLGLVEREVPVMERLPDKSRKGLYRISDPFVATWFAFVHPHRDLLERGAVDEVVDRFVRPRLAGYLSRAVEPVLATLLRERSPSELVPFPTAYAGRQWTASSELDVVLLDAERRRAFIAEIKWTKGKVGRAILDSLRARVQADAAFTGVDCTYAVISRAGFRGRTKLRRDERLVPASTLFDEKRAPHRNAPA